MFKLKQLYVRIIFNPKKIIFGLIFLVVLHSLPDSRPWIHPRCKCRKGFLSSEWALSLPSTCPYANFRGPKQRVISYSFYGNMNTYFKGVGPSAEAIMRLYPNWTMRLYHNIDPSDESSMSQLCALVCKHPHLDECYVGDIKNEFKDVEKKFGMLWRFLVMGDPTVDIFAVRDLDSFLYQREIDAVNDWLATNKTFHVMRDNLAHSALILGGMWGGRNTKKRSEMQRIRDEMIVSSNKRHKSYDQTQLARFVWPIAKNDMVAHDSFLCHVFPGSKPWPTPRVNRTFVGDMPGLYVTDECPMKCRPVDHQDWIYC